jgi:hypothetical protein
LKELAIQSGAQIVLIKVPEKFITALAEGLGKSIKVR